MKTKSKNSLTLIEMFVSMAILLILLAALSSILISGKSARSRNLKKVELFAEIKNLVYQITKDLRQTTSDEINSNSPTDSYLRFRLIEGFDTTSESLNWSSNYIVYTYASSNQTLERLNSTSGARKYFYNIISPPFSIGTLSDHRLAVNIKAEKIFRGSSIAANLTSEIKIRNE